MASTLGTVHIVTKKKNFDSNTNYAQGGIASVIAPGDTFDEHVEDTLRAGAGLCNRRAVEILVSNGPERVRELMEWGTRFSTVRDSSGSEVLDLGREGGHSRNRIVHATDSRAVRSRWPCSERIAENPRITVFEDHTAVDLLTEHQLQRGPAERQLYGAYIIENSTGDRACLQCAITVLAWAAGQVYQHTTNPEIATGDGIAMAYRAGALIADMEFIQFHPTTLYVENQQAGASL